jgi:hypothetical protein
MRVGGTEGSCSRQHRQMGPQLHKTLLDPSMCVTHSWASPARRLPADLRGVLGVVGGVVGGLVGDVIAYSVPPPNRGRFERVHLAGERWRMLQPLARSLTSIAHHLG